MILEKQNMKSSLRTFSNCNYGQVVKIVRSVNPTFNDSAFNYKMKDLYLFSKYAYTGYHQCGYMSLTLSYFLQKTFPRLEFKPGFVTYGYGKYYEDHLFITTEINGEEVIIDPTYKQYLENNTDDPKSTASEYLYRRMSPFFVGSKRELASMVHILLGLRKGKSLQKSKEDIMYWWDKREEFNHPFDLFDCHKFKKNPIWRPGEKILNEIKKLDF
jgi:hypothetical protein